VGFPVSARAQLSAEQLSVSCLLSDENIIREIYVSKVDNENESAALQLAFEDLLTQAEARYGPAGALRNQVVRHLAHLRHRQQNRALARHSGYQNLLRTQRVWHPAGYVQERSLNAWAFYQDNPEAFGRFLVQHLEPSETATQVYFYTNGETPVSELRIGTQ
jgi:hypothetical protein